MLEIAIDKASMPGASSYFPISSRQEILARSMCGQARGRRFWHCYARSNFKPSAGCRTPADPAHQRRRWQQLAAMLAEKPHNSLPSIISMMYGARNWADRRFARAAQTLERHDLRFRRRANDIAEIQTGARFRRPIGESGVQGSSWSRRFSRFKSRRRVRHPQRLRFVA